MAEGPGERVLVSGERRLALDALHERAARGAAGLRAMGFAEGDVVALLMRNDLAFLEATLAAQRAGLYPVPINWHLRGEEAAYILRDCGARLLVGHADLLAGVADDLPPGIAVLAVETPPEVAAAYRVPEAARRPDPAHRAWDDWLAAQDGATAPAAGPARESIIYTSGTTGRPKGVRRATARGEEAARVEAMRQGVYGFRDGMRTAIVAPMYHSAPNSYAVRALRFAERIVLLPRFDPEGLLAAIQAHAITHLFMVPTMFVRLLKLPEAVRAAHDVSSLAWVVHAGSPCPPDVKAAMIDWLGPVVHEFYGGTESSSVTYASSADARAKPGTVGRPVEGARVAIHRDDGSLAGPGEAGEIFMRIDYVPDFTYVGRDDLRAEVERDGLITCGDVGYLDADGYLFVCDRKRDMAIVGGVNVYPAEIEAVLTALPGVRDCAVFGIPHPEYGEELMALVQPLDGADLDPDAIRAGLARHLADYKVPRRIEVRSELPREESGKIFKRRLRDAYWGTAGRAI